MKRFLMASALVAPFMVQPALANNWTGAYGGISLGYAWGDADVAYDQNGGNAFGFGDPDPCDNYQPNQVSGQIQVICPDSLDKSSIGAQSLIDGVPLGSVDADGVMFGATFGINQQFGNWVVGIEGDVVELGLDETITGPLFITNFSAGDVAAASAELPLGTEMKIDGGLGVFASLRIGYSFNDDKTMVYGKAGYGGADLGVSVGPNCDYVLSICGGTWSENFTEAFVFGAGIEHMITKTMSVKVEYLRMEFDDTLAIGQNPDDFDFYDAYELDFSVDTVKVGLNFKIGSPL